MNTAAALQAGLRDRQSRFDNRTALTGSTRVFGAFKPLLGVGSTAFDVVFPHKYVEPPLMTFGAALDPNQSFSIQNPPTVSAVVTRWITEAKPQDSRGARGNRDTTYTGARVVAVVAGATDQRITVHLRFEGIAILYPAGERSTKL